MTFCGAGMDFSELHNPKKSDLIYITLNMMSQHKNDFAFVLKSHCILIIYFTV